MVPTPRNTFFVLFLFIGTYIQAQTKLGIDIGVDNLYAQLNNTEYIREQSPSYYYVNERINQLSWLNFTYAGLRIEKFIKADRIGISTGLRFVRMHGVFKADAPGYIYFLSASSETSTEYLRVSQIDQYSSYIGIPLDARFYFGRLRTFRFFAKGGFDFSLLIDESTDVTFKDAGMAPYESDVVSKIDSPGSFASMLRFSGGVIINQSRKHSFVFELNLPTLLLTFNTAGIVTPDGGGGVQASYLMRLKGKSE